MTKRTFSDSVVQHKTGTAVQWASINPTLAKGEIGVELDMGRMKIGDGVTTWANLPYIGQTSAAPVGHIQQQYVLETGYLALDGNTYSRTTYATLWAWAAANGLTAASPSAYQFGTGDGSTTFTVPNHIGRVWQGGSTVGQKSAGLPNLNGTTIFSLSAQLPIFIDAASGCFGKGNVRSSATVSTTGTSASREVELAFDASTCNDIYGKSETVQPPAIVLIPQIKY